MRTMTAIGIVIGFGLGLGLSQCYAQDATPTPLGTIKRAPAPVPSNDAVPSQRAPERRQRPVQQARQPAGPPVCWLAYVTPDSHTIQCSNGYWQTQMVDGSIVQGNGIIDPNANAPGSTIGINPATGGPSLKGDATVTAPGNIPMEAPHQAPMWGNQPLQTR